MHWPELPPVQGMLSTSWSPPGEVWPASGEFGTRSGVHSPVKVSSDSPPGHAAIVGAELTGPANTATAGATATATANPPARISRRAGRNMVAIVTLSVVVDRSRDSNRRCPPSHLLAETLRRLPGKCRAIVNKNGACVPFLEGCCGVAVAPRQRRLLWHRNVQSVRSFQANEVVRCGKP